MLPHVASSSRRFAINYSNVFMNIMFPPEFPVVLCTLLIRDMLLNK